MISNCERNTKNVKKIEYFIDENGCHICTSHFIQNGYPKLSVNCVPVKMSRFVYSMRKNVVLGPRDVIMHLCDNRGCINIRHLKLGTRQDNVADMYYKKRHAWGERNRHAKLTVDEAREIKTSTSLQKYAAKKYGVTQATISEIRSGKSWGMLE